MRPSSRICCSSGRHRGLRGRGARELLWLRRGAGRSRGLSGREGPRHDASRNFACSRGRRRRLAARRPASAMARRAPPLARGDRGRRERERHPPRSPSRGAAVRGAALALADRVARGDHERACGARRTTTRPKRRAVAPRGPPRRPRAPHFVCRREGFQARRGAACFTHRLRAASGPRRGAPTSSRLSPGRERRRRGQRRDSASRR